MNPYPICEGIILLFGVSSYLLVYKKRILDAYYYVGFMILAGTVVAQSKRSWNYFETVVYIALALTWIKFSRQPTADTASNDAT